MKQCTTDMASRAPISPESASRASSTMRAAASAAAWPERPGLALATVMASVAARITASGLGWLVAALSR